MKFGSIFFSQVQHLPFVFISFAIHHTSNACYMQATVTNMIQTHRVVLCSVYY